MPRSVRHPGVSPTIIDRVVGYVAPEYALKRLRARVAFDAFGGYTGASLVRRSLSQWAVTHGSADADLLPQLRILRQRARDLARNNPLAGGAIGGVVTSVVGTGLKAQSAIDADALGMTDDEAQAWQKIADREFALWAERPDCDITRAQDFYGIQELVFRSTLENGDCLTLLPFKKRQGSLYDLRLQVIEADRLVNKNWSVDQATMAGGVEMDTDGSPIAYWILREHPGNSWNLEGLHWDRYGAFGAKTGRRNVLHHYRKLRPGQTRGVPYLAPVMELIKQLGRYSEAEVMAAVVSGLFTVFVTSEGGGINPGIPGEAEETGATAADNDIKLGNGTIIDLKPGEKVEAPVPGRPNINFDPFVMSCLRQIGIALEVPFEVLVKHFSSSYTAGRAAILEAWKFYRGRRSWLVQSLCNPVYEAWMEEAVSKGRLDAPGFFDDPAVRRAYLGCLWHGDAMPQVDPVKEVQAARLRVELGVSNRAQETAQLTGGDWDVSHKEQVREANMRRRDGLDPDVPKAPGVNAVDSTDGGDDSNQAADEGKSGFGGGQ